MIKSLNVFGIGHILASRSFNEDFFLGMVRDGKLKQESFKGPKVGSLWNQPKFLTSISIENILRSSGKRLTRASPLLLHNELNTMEGLCPFWLFEKDSIGRRNPKGEMEKDFVAAEDLCKILA